MSQSSQPASTRRQLQKLALMAPAPVAPAAALGNGGRNLLAATPEATPSASLPPTPACGDDDELTLAQTEGPTSRRIRPNARH